MSARLAGSGISYGKPHPTRHVERAVAAAMAAAELDRVMGLFLFLTPEHLDHLQPALRAAARVSSCTQIFGCSAMGLFTDQDWIVDSSGAAALAIGNGAAIGLPPPAATDRPVVALATPEGASVEWLDQPVSRLGAIASDSTGRGPVRVWRSGRSDDTGTATCSIDGMQLHTVVAQGVRALTAPLEVAEADGFNLTKLGRRAALNVLIDALPPSTRGMERIPLHRLMCGIIFGDPATAIAEGRFRLEHIVAANPEDRSVTLADELHTGQHLFWALRDRQAAQREIERALDAALADAPGPPDFGLMFSCLGRGPGFYGGRDRDIEALRERCPGMPFVGFYGNGELAPMAAGSHLHSYTAAVGLCRRVDTGH